MSKRTVSAGTTPAAISSAEAGSRAPALTDQQRLAIETRDVSIALSAGAGCGKTFVLTRRFLSHLAPGPASSELSELVAITFTERAAREMRDRVRRECRRILDDPQTESIDHWLGLVRQLDSARISTIHAFCGSLLRAHAVEAELDPRFKLLDEATSASLLRSAVTEGLHTLLAAGNADSHDLVLELGLSRVGTLLEQVVRERYRIDFAAWRGKSPEEVAGVWQTCLRNDVAPRLLRDLAESYATRKMLTLLRERIPSHAVMQERRQALLDRAPELLATADPPALLEQLRQQARIQGGGGKGAWENEEIYGEVKDALTAFRAAVEKTAEQCEYTPADLLPAATLGLQLLRVAEKVGETYDGQKRAGAWLDFDDLLLRARDLLRNHPEVQRRVAAGISLLLVDEFQDTDPIQTEIVERLCGDRKLTGKLFVVGDAKQSIYRFRRAEPKVFRELRAQISREGRLPLTTNFRSQPAILSFVNALFDGALGPEYEPLVPSCQQLSEEPSIEFLFATDDAGSDEEGAELADDRRRREAQWIARRLSQLLADGKPRVREGTGLRPVRQKDMVILFRAMTDVRHYEAALRDCGLDYYVVGGQAFFAQQEVFDVVNLCRSLDDPDDEIALVGVLRSPFFSLSDDALLALARARPEDETADAGRVSLWKALAVAPPAWLSDPQKQRIRFAGRVLSELREGKDRLPLAQLLTLAIDRTGYDAALLTEFLGARKLANLRKLIDLARQFDRTGLFTLADFVDRLQESVGEETKEALAATHPESSDVIRLMSIHQSKGLEFPVVVVADMDRRGNEQPPPARFDPDLGPLVSLPEKFGVKRENLGQRLLRMREQGENLAETLRLLYVATTRAADHLILSANVKSPGEANHPWMKLLAERFDLSTGQPRQTPTADGMVPLVKYSARLPLIQVHHGCPAPVPGSGGERTETLPLREVRDALAATVPAPWPEMLDPIPVDTAARRRVSVSEIRQADARLCDRSEAPLDLSDDAPSRDPLDDQSGPERSSAGEDARRIGDVVHLALERIDLVRPRDAASEVAAAADSFPFRMDADIRQTASECVTSFLESTLRGEMASARRCEREIEFCLPWPAADSAGECPPRIITGKLDCLMQRSDGAWVIVDYKTGRLPAGKTEAHVLAEYEMQLAIYSLAVERLTGAWPARAELVLLRHSAKTIGFDAASAPWDTLNARIGAALREILDSSGAGLEPRE